MTSSITAPSSDRSSDHKSYLAIHGGPKGFNGPTGKAEPKIGVQEFLALAQRFGFNDQAMTRLRAAVSDADLTGSGPNLARFITSYPKPSQGEVFEELAKKKFGSPFARGTSSGTGALHAAMVGVGVGPGKEVIVPALGFMATAIAVTLAGGTPVFCDIDASLQIDPSKIEACISPRTVAIAPTHHWGTVCDMAPIMEIARRHNLKVIEDCAQSPGARYRGQYVGTIGDVGCFSISAYKIIGGGEGGLVLAKDQRIFDRICQLLECGGLWRSDRFAGPRYEGELFVGTNYRMSDLEAAVDVVQLGKLDDIVARHYRVSRRIMRQLLPCQLIQPQQINDHQGEIGYQLRFFPATVELGDTLVQALRAEGLWASMPDPKLPDWHYYADMYPLLLEAKSRGTADQVRCQRGDCPVADDLWFRRITIDMDQWWSAQDSDQVAATINKVLQAYCDPQPDAPAWL